MTPYTHLGGASADRIEVRGRDLVGELIGKLSFTEMFLFHLLGKEPSNLQRAMVDSVLVAIMEHGLVPSVIASRLTALGAPESYQGAVVAGLLGVGDRFAGTASECARLLDQIVEAPAAERAQRAIALVEEYRRERRALPGFGHPIHRNGDPRVPRLLEIARSLGAAGQYLDALVLLEGAVTRCVGRKLPMNVSAAIAAVLREAGLPAQTLRGVILTARCAGIVGHLLEEANEPAADAMWKAAEAAVTYQAPDRKE